MVSKLAEHDLSKERSVDFSNYSIYIVESID